MRKTVIETSCSRCARVETVSPVQSSPATDPDTQASQGSETPEPAFKALLVVNGVRTAVTFDDLCSPCGRAVKGLLAQVGKQIEGQSPDRKATRASKKATLEAKKPQLVPEKKPNGQQSHAKS
jgi:hypothetical protein